MRKARKESMVRMMKHLDAQMTDVSKEGIDELKNWLATIAKLLPPKARAIILLIIDVLEFVVRTYINPDGTKKRVNVIRLIKTGFKGFMMVIGIYSIYKNK